MTDKRFGRLQVIRLADGRKNRCLLWECLCDCGNKTVVVGTDLRSGHTRSCGCLHRDIVANLPVMLSRTHAQSKTRLYRILYGMRYRCESTKSKCYPSYGGRGITVCDEWRGSFENFRDWAMAHGYRDDLTIDRIDNDKGYSPDNCRWATIAEQNRNRRYCKKEAAPGAAISKDGETGHRADPNTP